MLGDSPHHSVIMAWLDRIQITIIGLVSCALLAVIVPNILKARRTPSTNGCEANLKQIQGAIETYALEMKLEATNWISINDISGGAGKFIRPLINRDFVCPAGGVYSISLVSQPPRCSIHGP